MTVFCWSLQFIFGFAVYFFGSDASTKKQYSALHIKWGLFVFVLGCVSERETLRGGKENLIDTDVFVRMCVVALLHFWAFLSLPHLSKKIRKR